VAIVLFCCERREDKADVDRALLHFISHLWRTYVQRKETAGGKTATQYSLEMRFL